MTSVALVTIAHGRHDHLTRQYEAVASSTVLPDATVLVGMDDSGLSALRFERVRPRVIDIHGGRAGLPLAAARNAGAAAAIAEGAEVLVFLDVDCLPAPGLVEAYAAAATDPRWADRLLCGPVAYLPPAPAAGYDLARLDELAQPHAARPAPPPGEVVAGHDPSLFWSLSFALTAHTWERVGGFCEMYEGYGAEDTDFARIAATRGVGLAWVGAARAFHQHHPTQSPPVQHLDDIVRNANTYFRRWGDWPMEGWLAGFANSGLITWTADTLARMPEDDTARHGSGQTTATALD